MIKCKIYFLIPFILLISCASQAQGSRSEIISIGQKDTLSQLYFQKTPCEKIEYLTNLKSYNLKFYESAIRDMYQITKIPPSVSAGYIGVYYESDSLRLVDLQKWRLFLKCDSISK
jgi:hypothetical protein